MTRDELATRIEKELAALRTLRDEIRLDLHLAGMEARDRWTAIEPRIEEAELLARDVTEASRKAIAEIGDRVRAYRAATKH
jgi:hypothetical protein